MTDRSSARPAARLVRSVARAGLGVAVLLEAAVWLSYVGEQPLPLAHAVGLFCASLLLFGLGLWSPVLALEAVLLGHPLLMMATPHARHYSASPFVEVALFAATLPGVLRLVFRPSAWPRPGGADLAALAFVAVASLHTGLDLATHLPRLSLESLVHDAILRENWLRDPSLAYSVRPWLTLLEGATVYLLLRASPAALDAARLGRLFAVVATVIGGVAIIQYTRVDLSPTFQGVNRATGPYTGPNLLGAFLALALPPAVAAAADLRPRWAARAAVLGVASVAGTALWLSRSRGAFLAVVVAGALALAAGPLRRTAPATRKRVALAAGLLVAVATAMLLALVPSSELNAWTSGRAHVWLTTLRVFLENPLHGVGLGRFLVVMQGYYPTFIEQHLPDVHAHNLWLHTAAELGLVGLVPLALWFGLTARAGLRVARTAALPARGIVLGLVAMLVHGLVDHTLLAASVTIPAAYLAGALARLEASAVTPPPTASGRGEQRAREG